MKTFPLGTLLTLIFGVALIVLDSTIVGVSLPTIIADLGLTLTQAAWVTSLYSVVFAALLLTMGTLGDKYGTRRMFMIGLIFFAVGSLMAAVASSFIPLLIARGIQGIGGAIVLPATLSAINSSFRGPQRAAAFGAWGATMASAAAIGPPRWRCTHRVSVLAVDLPRKPANLRSADLLRVDKAGPWSSSR